MGESSAAAEVRAALRAVALPERAAGQQAYMKSAMPYLGVTVPDAMRTGRWWDYTDELAHRLPPLLERDAATADLVRTWSTDDDLWMRRMAIISQLGRKDAVDRQLLADTIEPNLGDGEFFIRKAIGWALRDLARVDPAWVKAYAASHELSPLSRREALKHL